jgi:hypothetical protein
VADGEQTERVRSAGDRSDVVRQGKDRPVVGDGTEVAIFGVGEDTVVDELSPNGNISTSLVGSIVQLDVELAIREDIRRKAYVVSGKVRGSVYRNRKDLQPKNDGDTHIEFDPTFRREQRDWPVVLGGKCCCRQWYSSSQ